MVEHVEVEVEAAHERAHGTRVEVAGNERGLDAHAAAPEWRQCLPSAERITRMTAPGLSALS